jgi:hypothetical protein
MKQEEKIVSIRTNEHLSSLFAVSSSTNHIISCLGFQVNKDVYKANVSASRKPETGFGG